MALREAPAQYVDGKVPQSLDCVLTISSFRMYLSTISSIPVLSHSELDGRFRALEQSRHDGDEPGAKKIADGITLHNLPFVVFLAKKRQGFGVPLADLVQVGNIGLMEAVDRYDVERGYRFTTYSSWWINGEISDAIRDTGSLVRIPRTEFSLARAIERERRHLEQKYGAEHISPTAIADALSVPVAVVRNTLRSDMLRTQASLDEPLETGAGQEEGETFGTVLVDSTIPSVEERATHNQFSTEVMRNFTKLPETVQKVLGLRTGMHDGVERSWAYIAARLGYSIAFVQTVYEDGLASLRFTIGDECKQESPASTERQTLGLTPEQWRIWTVSENEGAHMTTRELSAYLGIPKVEVLHTLGHIHKRSGRN